MAVSRFSSASLASTAASYSRIHAQPVTNPTPALPPAVDMPVPRASTPVAVPASTSAYRLAGGGNATGAGAGAGASGWPIIFASVDAAWSRDMVPMPP